MSRSTTRKNLPWVSGYAAATTGTFGAGGPLVAANKLSYTCDDALLARVTGIVGDAGIAASVCETYDCTTGKRLAP